MERRQFIRFFDQDSSLTHVEFMRDPLKQRGKIPALIYDENFDHVSCVLLCDAITNNDLEIIWHENIDVQTKSKIIRFENLYKGIYRIIFTFK